MGAINFQLHEATELCINTDTVDNMLKICLLSTIFAVFTLDNTFISSMSRFFTSLITKRILHIINGTKLALIPKIIFYALKLTSKNSQTKCARRAIRLDVPSESGFLTSLQTIFRGETGQCKSIDCQSV